MTGWWSSTDESFRKHLGWKGAALWPASRGVLWKQEFLKAYIWHWACVLWSNNTNTTLRGNIWFLWGIQSVLLSGKKNADTTHSARVTVRLKRPAAGSSTPKMKGKDKAFSLTCSHTAPKSLCIDAKACYRNQFVCVYWADNDKTCNTCTSSSMF